MRGWINISELEKSERKKQIVFKNILKVFLKTGKNRLLLTIISGTIIFLLLTSFFMVWFTYRQSFFNNKIATNYDWNNDNQISVHTCKYNALSPYFESNYLEKAIDDFTEMANDIVPNIATEDYTGAMSVQLFNYDPAFLIWKDIGLMTFDESTMPIMEDSITEGRMPTNSNELLYFKQDNTSTVELNDIYALKGYKDESDVAKNCTIVGIVEGIATNLYHAEKSVDILNWEDIVRLNYNIFYAEEVFFTKSSFLYETINSFSRYYGSIAILTDFDYDTENLDAKHIRTYLNNFKIDERTLKKYVSSYLSQNVILVADLYQALYDFHISWTVETSRVFALSSPLIFLIGLLCMQTLKIGSYELETKFRLMKLHGLNEQTVRKVIFVENVFISGICFLLGFILGVVVGFFFSLMIGNTSIITYIGSLSEPSIYFALVIFWISFAILGFLLEGNIADKTAKVTSEHFKRKRTKMREIMASTESVSLIIGLILVIIALLIAAFVNTNTFDLYFINPLITLESIFWLFLVIGIIFVVTTIFSLISRVITLIWTAISKSAWQKTKSFLTLSLKHLGTDRALYHTIVMFALIIGIGLLPGLVLSKSIDNHYELESELSAGCSDLIVFDWEDDSGVLKETIRNITSIEAITEVKTTQLNSDNLWGSFPTAFSINILEIENITIFKEIVETDIINEIEGYLEKLDLLETNDTILIDSEYASAYNLETGDILTSSRFTGLTPDIDLVLVDIFDCFPLLKKPIKSNFLMNLESYNIVTNRYTADKLCNNTSNNIPVNEETSLIIKIEENVNATLIKEKLFEHGISALSQEDIELKLHSEISDFFLAFIIFSSIITLLSQIIIGYIGARNIYQARTRIIEAMYRIGCKRKQLWQYFSIELLFIALPIILVSIFAFIPLVRIVGTAIFGLYENYLRFILWLPWWIIIIAIFASVFTLVIGWLSGIIPLIRGYKPHKQE